MRFYPNLEAVLAEGAGLHGAAPVRAEIDQGEVDGVRPHRRHQGGDVVGQAGALPAAVEVAHAAAGEAADVAWGVGDRPLRRVRAPAPSRPDLPGGLLGGRSTQLLPRLVFRCIPVDCRSSDSDRRTSTSVRPARSLLHKTGVVEYGVDIVRRSALCSLTEARPRMRPPRQ